MVGDTAAGAAGADPGSAGHDAGAGDATAPPARGPQSGTSQSGTSQTGGDPHTGAQQPAGAMGRKGPLKPIELADAAVLGGVTLLLVLVGWFFPHANAITALAAVPMAVVAYRHRQRAVVASAVASGAVGFLVAGTGPVASVAGCALVGGLAGHAHRHKWGMARTAAAALVFVPPLGGASDAFLAVFSESRRLTLDQVRNTWKGTASLLRNVPGSTHVLSALTVVVNDSVRWWWLAVPAGILLSLVAAAVVAWALTGPVVERLAWIASDDPLPSGDRTGPPAPVPVTLHDVHYRYPDSREEALAGVDVTIEAGTLTAVVGPNGSGKSTLARVLLGTAPSGGSVIRPGHPGLGQVGGTAVILQRPETQVLGVRVVDDLLWGLPPGVGVDVERLLATVGLEGMDQRDTSTLSGGELQRLAIAAAIARRPRLLISDESTAMVDPAGREALMALLRRLPGEEGTAVVHITHRLEETDGADQVMSMRGGRRTDDLSLPGDLARASGRAWPRGGAWGPAGRPSTSTADYWAADLVLEDVGHTWAEGTPWQKLALEGVNLRIDAGEGVLILGANGSGKSTLAWIMAGLLVPSRGSCSLGGRPVEGQVGAVGLAFQHARLQLQRPSVLSDVRDAAGVGRSQAAEALESVGLDPSEVGSRHVDELSGGQMRRVALAGLLAHRPKVMVLDEPFAGLDDEGREGLVRALRDLRSRHGVTVIMVSHDVAGTEACCNRVVRLESGRLVADESFVRAGR